MDDAFGMGGVERAAGLVHHRDHFGRVLKDLRLGCLDRVTAERIEWRIKSEGLAINSKHGFVAGVARDFLDVLVVIAKRDGETIDFDGQPLLEELLAPDHFVLQPLLVFRAARFLFIDDVVALAQILVRGRVRLDIDAGVTHFRELLPGDRLAPAEMAAAHAFGVNEKSKRIVELLHDRPADLVLGFPTVIERDDGAARRNIFLPTFPR